jgi:hypothetical protein
MIDSPTTTQLEIEVQVTAVKVWGASRVVGLFQGFPGRPVAMICPAWGASATELPTAMHAPTVGHDTSATDAESGLTLWFVQVAPPSSEVRMSPCPLRVASRVSAVLPTAVQITPEPPATGMVVEAEGEEEEVGEPAGGVEPGVDVETDVGAEPVEADVDGAVAAGATPALAPVGDCSTQDIPLR